MSRYPPPPAWASALRSIGVTGTNGKTSTTTYVAAALAALGDPVAWVTTVEAGVGDPRRPTAWRAPPEEHGGFLALMDEARVRGGRWAAIEATSASLALGFARAWPCQIAVFTNLGHDHMRTHGTPEHYLASKAQLFAALGPGGTAVLNAGDPNAELIAEIVPTHAAVRWFAGPGRALEREVDLRVTRAEPSWAGLEVWFEARLHGRSPELGTARLANPAAIQAENFAAALLAALVAGVPLASACGAIAECPAPPGRFERLDLPVGVRTRPDVVIDYAHDPDALRNLLADARRLAVGSVVLVFGAGGGPDSPKRAAMGSAAGLADRVWLTSDNPRDEDPAAIAAVVHSGLPSGLECTVELDRERAIAGAIAQAGPDDLVLIAGKGHESVQITGSGSERFSDRDVARRCLLDRG